MFLPTERPRDPPNLRVNRSNLGDFSQTFVQIMWDTDPDQDIEQYEINDQVMARGNEASVLVPASLFLRSTNVAVRFTVVNMCKMRSDPTILNVTLSNSNSM